jgi:CRP-like cAMP-binding protein
MSLEQDIEILRKVPLFAPLSPETLRLLAFGAEPRDFIDGNVIFREGDPAESAFVVMDGQVDLVRERIKAKTLLASLGPGSLIGELALIVQTSRPCKAVAIGKVRCQMIRRITFRRVLEEFPAYALQLRQQMAARVGGLAPEIGQVVQSFSRIDKPGA